MIRRIFRSRVVVTSMLMLTLLCPVTFARDSHRGEERHYYRDGNYYKRGWFGLGALVTVLAIGAFVESLPPKHNTVVIGDTQYYHDDRYYYREVPNRGYVVVTPPVIVQSQYPIPETSTINIPNSRGGYTAVTLIRNGTGFVGPQGEFYQTFPSVEQLRTIYGN
jgi:hypothetical protein